MARSVAVARPVVERPQDRSTEEPGGRRATFGRVVFVMRAGAAFRNEPGSTEWVVLDQNRFEIDPHQISRTKVELTMMNGIIRHRDGI